MKTNENDLSDHMSHGQILDMHMIFSDMHNDMHPIRKWNFMTFCPNIVDISNQALNIYPSEMTLIVMNLDNAI